MRFSLSQALMSLLTAQAVSGSSWFGKTAYNKWHETELERWLSDNDIPYPSPSDRKDLENLMKANWNDYVVDSYNSWDADQIQKYLTLKGEEVKKGTEKNKDALIQQLRASWTETSDSANDAYASTRDWIFDTWTESQLKAFLDYNGIPSPQPRTRDTLLTSARENYQSIATKISETISYPGDWLYQSWSDSDLKAWLDARGIPVYQGSQRNQLIARVRRNSRNAGNNVAAWSSSLSASAASATASLADSIFDAWSDSQLKKWADEKGLQVPQGSKRNELLALVRRQNAKFNSSLSQAASSASSAYDAVSSSATSVYGEASLSASSVYGEASSSVSDVYDAVSSTASDQYARATDEASFKLDGSKNVFFSYIDWMKAQLGLVASTVSASASSLGVEASKSAYLQASKASASASSLASAASKSYESAASVASKSAASARDEL